MAGEGNHAPTANGGGARLAESNRTPTEEMYGDLQRAYKLFNSELFDDSLPECLITLRARGRTNGYFSEARFVHPDGGRTAEIALNPERFYTRTIEACLSTLVHEMVHLWQKLHGTAPKRPYHNKEFAEKMEAVGLITSHTGEPDGRRVGQQMTHYIQPEGRFLRLTRTLLDEHFRARWADRFRTYSDTGEWRGWQEPAAPADVVEPSAPAAAELGNAASVGIEATSVAEPAPHDVDPPEGEGPPDAQPPVVEPPVVERRDPEPQPARSLTMAQIAPDDYQLGAYQRSLRSKTKWQCPSCKDAAWGKPSLSLRCTKCDVLLTIPQAADEAEPLSDSPKIGRT